MGNTKNTSYVLNIIRKGISEITLTPDSEPIPRPVAKEIVSLPTKFKIDADLSRDTAHFYQLCHVHNNFH